MSPPEPPDVALVHWPDEAAARAGMARSGRPRLLLVAAGETPPAPVDDLEDWISLPASEVEMHRRVMWLRRRLAVDDGGPIAPPSLEGDGRLHTTGGVVELPPVEARIVRALLDHYGAVLSREAMARAGWPSTSPSRNTVDVQILRLRRHLAAVGLGLVTVRRRGYRLQPVDAGDASVSDTCQTSDQEP